MYTVRRLNWSMYGCITATPHVYVTEKITSILFINQNYNFQLLFNIIMKGNAIHLSLCLTWSVDIINVLTFFFCFPFAFVAIAFKAVSSSSSPCHIFNFEAFQSLRHFMLFYWARRTFWWCGKIFQMLSYCFCIQIMSGTEMKKNSQPSTDASLIIVVW